MPSTKTSPAKPRRAAEPKFHGRWYGDACAAAFGMELIGERWSILVIREMMLGPRRFGEIRAVLPGLSAKTLTERLETLEQIGIVCRQALPGGAQAYALTEWGRGLEPVMQALGRWSVRSPQFDRGLTLTPVSLMLSLRTMIDHRKAAALDLWVEMVVGDSRFGGRLRGGDLAIHPASGPIPNPDLRFSAASANDYLPVIYGKRSVEEAGGRLSIEGDPGLADRFIDLFALPR
jgi:DNA-binding HxlR family transcriptional regulator